MKSILFLFVFLLSGMLSSLAGNNTSQDTTKGNLLVRITGFENSKGTVKIALVNSKESYDSNENIFRGAKVPVIDQKAAFTFENIPFGTYAVKVFHDENDNDDLDTNFLGIPKEAFGFSNNARGKFGPPGFEQTRFEITRNDTTLHIEVKKII